MSQMLAASDSEIVRAGRTSVLGFGYEGLTQGELVAQLRAAEITLLVDVRLNPISRKPGLSKTRLAAAVRDVGIEYQHLRGLGNPKWNRPGFAVGDLSAHAAYVALLAAGDGERDLATLGYAAESERVGLLCFEANEDCCHRSLILNALAVAGSDNRTRR